MTYAIEPIEKKEPRTRTLEVVGFIVTLLVAITSLLSNSNNVPWWWFYFSFAFLVSLAFLIPSMTIFGLPNRVTQLSLEMKKNAVARRHFEEFKALVNTAEKFSFSIGETMNALRSHYQQSTDSHMVDFIIRSYNAQETNNVFYYIKKEIGESDETFRDLYLITKHLECVLSTYWRNIRIIEEFVRDIRDLKGKPIDKGVERNYESFREQYNLFLNDFTKFCHRVNQEIGENLLAEYGFSEPIKAW